MSRAVINKAGPLRPQGMDLILIEDQLTNMNYIMVRVGCEFLWYDLQTVRLLLLWFTARHPIQNGENIGQIYTGTVRCFVQCDKQSWPRRGWIYPRSPMYRAPTSRRILHSPLQL
jgi:hypothetical protein